MGRRAALAASLLLSMGGFACSKRKSDAAPSARPVPPVAPAPPAGLMAELVVADASAFWKVSRELIGLRGATLPKRFEPVVAVVLGLPGSVANFLAADRPLFGVWLLADGEPSLVLALKLRSAAELVLELTRSGGGYRAERDAASGVTRLVGTAEGRALGVREDWLLVGDTAPALSAAGAYVTDVLAARPLPIEASRVTVPRAALAGPFTEWLRSRLDQLQKALAKSAEAATRAAGRRADFADPTAVLGLLERASAWLLALVADGEALRATVLPTPFRLELSLELEPRAGGPAARFAEALLLGPIDPLLTLPSGAACALLIQGADATAAPDAAHPSDVLGSLFGARLREGDAKRMRAVLERFARGFRSRGAYALYADHSLVARQAVRDAVEAERALEEGFALLDVPALSAPLAALVGPLAPRASTLRVGASNAAVHRVALGAPNGPNHGLEAFFRVDARDACVALGRAARARFAALSEPTANAVLGANPELRAAAERRGPVAYAAFLDLYALTPGRPAVLPVLASLSRRDGRPRLALELSDVAVALFAGLVGGP